MKFLLLLIAAVSMSLSLVAQPPAPAGRGRITGRILDAESRRPIEFASVSLFGADSTKPLNGAATTSKGTFILQGLPAGTYTITVAYIGYQTHFTGAITLGSNNMRYDLGDIHLSKSAQDLAAVTVTPHQDLVENKIDKMVYNAEKDITSQGGVATDILKKVPMVSVDVDGNVQLQGSSNVLFLINGKPSSVFGNSLADALQTIPASQIQRIEVITSPGAKYDAEGTGGIINIILKENRLKGINSNISVTAGSRLENGSLNLNARHGNFGFNARLSGSAHLPSTTKNSSDRLSLDTATGIKESLLQEGSSDFHRQGYNTGLGFDWTFNRRNTISGNFGYDHFGFHREGATRQQQSQYTDAPGAPISDSYSLVRSGSDFQGRSLDWSLNYKRKFAQEDRELNISYDASFGNNHSSYYQAQSLPSGDSTFRGSNSVSDGHDHETNFRLDYEQPLGDNIKLETGARVQLRRISSLSAVNSLNPATSEYRYDSTQSNLLSYNRNVYAGYASLAMPVFKWLDVKAGLRYERTETDAGFSHAAAAEIPGYNTFAPSVVLSHTFDNDQTLKLAYVKRIRRPDYRRLNPYVNASDPKNITTGNPYLSPESGFHLDLGYNKSFGQGNALGVVLFYHRSDDDIQNFITYYPAYTIGDSVYYNTSVSVPMNVGSQNNYGMHAYGSVSPADGLDLRGNFSLYDRYITTGSLTGDNVTSFNYRINLNATYQLSKTFVLEFFGDFNSPRNEIQGRYPSWTSYNFAFRKQLWDKKGSIAFSATNPFAADVRQETSVSGANFLLNSLRQVPYRSFGINFTYKFGKLEFKKDKAGDQDIPDAGDSE